MLDKQLPLQSTRSINLDNNGGFFIHVFQQLRRR